MASGKSVLLAGLLACLAVSSVLPQAAAYVNQRAVYDCPDTPRMKGCAPSGCALQTRGRTSHLVCAQCMDDRAYVLVNGGTRKASCECAAGFAGRGQDGLCKKCPADTDIAEGGSISKSVCLKCPKGSYVNSVGTDCVCPAGHYKAVADQQPGFKKIACQPCQARNAYIAEDGHSKETCSLCKLPLVANKDHTACVPAENPEAAPSEGGLLGSVTKRAADSPLGGLAAAFEEGRVQGQQDRLMRMESRLEGRNSPLKALADRIRASTRRQDKHSSVDKEEAEVAESHDHKAKRMEAREESNDKHAKKHAKEEEKVDKVDKVDPNLAAKLIPSMPSEEAVAAHPPAASPTPSGPVSLKDLAKKFGGALGASGPSRGFVGSALGYIDPEALADAGLPAVDNVGSLMSALVKKQFGDLDMSEWKAGVKGDKQM